MATARDGEKGALRIYRTCLALYPAEFRDEYARELCMAFTDRWREERSARVWFEGLGGILKEAPKEHLHVILKDLRYAVRILRKDLTVTLAALIILALGIGATTLVFSLANGLLLRPLPYPDPGRLVSVEEYSPKDPHESGSVSLPNFMDYAARARLVENPGIYGGGQATLRGEGGAETVPAGFVSDGIFRALGVQPLLGRTFTREECSPNGPKTLILGEELWDRRYARDPQIVGRSIDFGDGKRTVVGIMPADFHFFPARADIWVPEQQDPSQTRRTDLGANGLARLKPGVTPEQATAEAEAILQQIFRENPAANNHWKARVVPLRSKDTQNYRKQMIALLVAVGLLLAIACANVSNLMLVKASARSREMAVRMAIGASRRRLVRQLASESLVLGMAGGAMGTALAYVTLPAMLALVPADLPRWMNFSLDWRVLVFAVAVSLTTSLAFGVVPAFSTSRVDLSTAIKDGGRSGSGARYKLLRNGLVVCEVALSMILLAGAGLTLRSFLALRTQNLGYRPDHVLSLEVVYPAMRYPAGPKAHDLIRRLTADVSTLPGVRSAAFTTGIPLHDGWSRIYNIEGRPKTLQDMAWANHVVVVPGYFATLGIPLLEGRDFTESDYDEQHKLIVTRAFAHANWPNESAIGKHVRFGPPDRNEPWNTIVGVVADNRHEQLKGDGRPVVYLTYSDDIAPSSLLVRTSGEPAKIVPAIRARIRAFDPDIALYHVITLPELIERASWQDRFLAVLFLAFAVLALTLASVGLYAALSYTVSLHSREIGIRMALGASTGNVQGMLLRQGMALAASGLALGLAGAFGLTRWLESQLFNVSTHDPLTYAITPLVLLTVAMFAVWIPARRATRVDPATVLRFE